MNADRIDALSRERQRQWANGANRAVIDRLTAEIQKAYDRQRQQQAGRMPAYRGTTTRWPR